MCIACASRGKLFEYLMDGYDPIIQITHRKIDKHICVVEILYLYDIFEGFALGNV